MSSHEAYLRTALSKYQYKDIAKRDIMNAFQSFTDLRPMKSDFVFNDGSKKELLCLDGTIPVNYRGSVYNIPVSMWLIETHPYNPPMVYVKPTSSMQIKPGRHVDTNGKIYLPYLHEWKHPQSDLMGLIQILTIIFGEDPPVFAKSAGQAGSTGATPPSRPPYPGASTTPYPAQGGAMPMPTPGSSYPPQQPPYPNTSYPAYTPYGSQQQPYTSQAPTTAPYSGYGAPATGYPPQQAATQGSSASVNSQQSLSEEQIRASLQSAVEDKMKRRLKEIFAQSQAEMDSLKRTQDDLQKGKTTLDDMLQRLEKEQNDVERNITILKEKNDEVRDILGKMENREEVKIDDAVVPSAPIYRQLLNAFAEEQATEDAIYHLSEGLKQGVIDLDAYLKRVRELSRKQFMLRALMQKCRAKAGLPEVVFS